MIRLSPAPVGTAARSRFNAAALRTYGPGLAVALVATMAAGLLAEKFGLPLVLLALLAGLSLNFVGRDDCVKQGLSLATGPCLRIGIVLMGLRVSVVQLVDLGWLAWLCVALIITATITVGVLVARRMGSSFEFGILCAGAVAICGGSAAAAIGACLGERHLARSDLAQVLVGISIASALAMFTYPAIAQMLMLTDRQAGFLLGASIHDVAQSIGAGYAFSPQAGQVAAIVKLSRVALLPVVLLGLASWKHGTGSSGTVQAPWFVLGFFVLMVVQSQIAVPAFVTSGAEFLSTTLLALAIAATGIGAPLSAMRGEGIRSTAIIAAASLTSFALALIAAILLF